MLKKWVGLFLAVVTTAVLYAQESPAPTTTPVDEKSLTFTDAPAAPPGAAAPAQVTGDLTIWDFLRMFLILAAVIGMIYGFILFLRKLSGQQNPSNAAIKVLSTHILSGNKALYLVEIGNEILLVGAGDSSVNLIKVLSDQETIDSLRLASSQSRPAPKGQFLFFLKKFLGKPEPKEQKIADPVIQSTEFLKSQRDRLKGL